MGGLAHKHFLKKDGKSLDDYYALDPKGDDKKKYDKQVRDLLISWQIHLGWDNPELDRHYKRAYRKSEDLSKYPQDICTTIRILNGAEDEWKKKDTHRGKNQADEQDAGSSDEVEKTGEDEEPSQERVSGAHYVPLSEGQVLLMVKEGHPEILDTQHSADNFEDERAAAVIVATPYDLSDEESSNNEDDGSMPELQIHLPYDLSDEESSGDEDDDSLALY